MGMDCSINWPNNLSCCFIFVHVFRILLLFSPNSTCCVTTRHRTLSSTLAQEKIVTCYVALVGQHGATRSSRQARQARPPRHVIGGVATAWTGVDMSTSLFPEVVPEIDVNPEHKRLNLYTRALLLLRCPPCWNKHGTTRTASAT